ncbi:hypothetical protein ACIRJO_30110 [Streptomyces sp. NPDC102394]|uniref:hypothetical protein n=1 Tax=Streptomyces sp. NPDC102394 TaxID=3366167 RepID=UPI00381E1F34
MPGLRADRDFEPVFTMLRRKFGWVPAIDNPLLKVIDVQRDLVRIGHHRSPPRSTSGSCSPPNTTD